MKASLRFLRTIRCVSHVLSLSVLLLFADLGPTGRDRKNCTNQLNLGRGNHQKTE
jgi:hypothetical protein